MKPKTTIILLLAVAALFAFIQLKERTMPTTDELSARAKRVLDVKSGDITKIQLQEATTNYTGRIVVEKEKDKWWMREPLATRASASKADEIASQFEFLDKQATITQKEIKEKGGKLADYGLEKPAIEATFWKKDKSSTIKVGKAAPVGNSVYIQLGANDDVLVVGKDLLTKLDLKVEDLRERSLLEFSTYQVNRMEITQGKKAIELVKAPKPGAAAVSADKSWRIAQPIKARADQSKVDGLADKLHDLKIDTFVNDKPADLKPYEFDQPQLEVTLYTTEQEGAFTVQFGASLKDDPTKVYCKRKGNDSVYAVKSDIIKDFTIQVNDLRDKKLADFTGDDAKLIAINYGGQSIKLEKDKEDWNITEPEAAKAEQGDVSNLLTTLTGLEAKEFVADVVTDPAKYGLDKPYYTVVVKKEAPKPEMPASTSTNATASITTTNVVAKAASTNVVVATTSAAVKPEFVTLVELQFGKEEKDQKHVYVKRADEPYIYAVDNEALDKLPKTAMTLRSRSLVTAEKSKVTKLTSTHGAAKIAVEKKDDKWKLAPDVQGVLDTAAVDDVLWTLTGLTVEKFVSPSPSDASKFGLDKPAWLLDFELNEGGTNKSFELSLGNETKDKGRYGLLRGQPQIFELSASTTSSLTKDLLKRPETNLPPVKVTAPVR